MEDKKLKKIGELIDSCDEIIDHISHAGTKSKEINDQISLVVNTFKKIIQTHREKLFSEEGIPEESKDDIIKSLEDILNMLEGAKKLYDFQKKSDDLDFPDLHANENKTVSKAQVHQGKMHKVLGVKAGEKIEDKYKTGESLYNALSKRLSDHDKTMKMLNYAANISKEKDIFDAAVRYGKERKTDGDNS